MRIATPFVWAALLVLLALPAQAQIFEPEGLNLTGGMVDWGNPPAQSALRSANQGTAGGEMARDTTLGLRTYRSGVIQAVADGVDANSNQVQAGTSSWLFTSGPTSNFYANKWGGVTVAMNTVQTYTFQGADNAVTLTDGKFYVVRWQDNGYGNTQAVWFELDAMPVSFSTVTDNKATRQTGAPLLVTLSMSGDPATSGEKVFVRWTVDGFATSTVGEATCVGALCTFEIPAWAADAGDSNPADGGYRYYAFTSTGSPAADGADADMLTINVANNDGLNFALPVELTSFSAMASGRTAVLSWVTASETNNAGFEVETHNGSAWTSLGFVEGQGTTDRESNYRFTTGDLALGVHTFRLRQVDFDGTTSFSPTVEVAILADDAMVTLAGANPFRTETAVQIATPSAQQVRVALFDMLGRQVADVFAGEISGIQTVRVHADVPAGMYLLRVTGDTFSHTTTLTRVR